MMAEQDKQFMQAAIDMALEGMRKNEGGPFGAVIVKDGKIIGDAKTWKKKVKDKDDKKVQS